ncbi:hypothetical protein HJG60_010443 [Phyllostomus discolor]|uniref:Uncharacterized protein n=1 Tax=Phyllostomus discolor TaxID=89673 RepID=A0A834AN04_9CHIR|nr:hypothetical protein HJG60_010443 [Phyllostomus discolor]
MRDTHDGSWLWLRFTSAASGILGRHSDSLADRGGREAGPSGSGRRMLTVALVPAGRGHGRKPQASCPCLRGVMLNVTYLPRFRFSVTGGRTHFMQRSGRESTVSWWKFFLSPLRSVAASPVSLFSAAGRF